MDNFDKNIVLNMSEIICRNFLNNKYGKYQEVDECVVNFLANG